MFINLRIPTLTALAVIQVLATSCGGGGGGSEPSSTVRESFEDGSEDLASSNVRTGLESQVGSETLANLALAEPKEGSVSQSSNRDGSDVTEDIVEVTGLAGVYEALSDESSLADAFSLVTIAVSGGDVSITLSESSTGVTSSGYDVESGSAGTYSTREIEIVNGNALSSAAFLAIYDLPGNTDWAAVGIWLHTEDSSGTNWNLGVFADTSNPTAGLDRLTGRFSYKGASVGYAVTQDNDDEYDFYTFTADAELDANFDTNSVSGSILNITSHDEEAQDFNTAAEDIIIVLNQVDLTDNNFFKGSVNVQDVNSDAESGSGNWGGQFFGNNAEGIIGTYGGNIDDDSFFEGLKKFSFGGSFIAVAE